MNSGEHLQRGGRLAAGQRGPQRGPGRSRRGRAHHGEQHGMRQVRAVAEPHHAGQPEPQRDAHVIGPGPLGDQHLAVEGVRGQHGERQYRQREARDDTAEEHQRAARRPRHPGQQDQHREDGPGLAHAGEPEREAARAEPPPAAGQVVAVHHRQRPGQAEQHQPRLDQHGVRGVHAVRIDGQEPARHRDRQRAAVPDQQAGQRHPARARAGGQDAADGQGLGGAERPGERGHRRHQQHHPGWLHGDEVLVRDRAVDQPHGAAEVDPVVVFGDPEQVAVLGQLPQPQEQSERGGDDDGQHDRGQPPSRARRRGRGAGQATGRGGRVLRVRHGRHVAPHVPGTWILRLRPRSRQRARPAAGTRGSAKRMDKTSVSSPKDVPEITTGGSGPGRPATMMGLCGPAAGRTKS